MLELCGYDRNINDLAEKESVPCIEDSVLKGKKEYGPQGRSYSSDLEVRQTHVIKRVCGPMKMMMMRGRNMTEF